MKDLENWIFAEVGWDFYKLTVMSDLEAHCKL